jgi:transketolase
MEPSCEKEVGMLLDWSINATSDSCYLRLMSLPWVVPYELAPDYRPQLGRGVALTEGNTAIVIGYGPVLLSAAVQASAELARGSRITVKVLNLPWLNRVDPVWLRQQIGACRMVFSLDNHYAIGGQGDRIAEVFAAGDLEGKKFFRIAVEDIPVCGTNSEVLNAHRLDYESLAAEIHRRCVP